MIIKLFITISMDFYEILGANKTDTLEEIKKKYRDKVRQIHPDSSGTKNAIELFTQIQKAFDILSDTNKRQLYDLYGPENMDKFNDLFSDGPNYSETESETESDSEDEEITYWEPEKWPEKANIYLKFTINIEDIFKGCIKKVTLERYNDCLVEPFEFDHPIKGPTIKYCYVGKDPSYDKLLIELNPWDPKQSYESRGCIPFENMGHALPPDMQEKHKRERGTLYVIPATDGKYFEMGFNPFNSERRPENLYKEVRLSFGEALLGFEKRINHPIGKYLILRDWGKPIAHNTLKIFREWGMPVYGSDKQYGNLFIRFKVDPPINMTQDKKDQIKKLLSPSMKEQFLDPKKYNEDTQLEIRITDEIIDELELWEKYKAEDRDK